MTASLR